MPGAYLGCLNSRREVPSHLACYFDRIGLVALVDSVATTVPSAFLVVVVADDVHQTIVHYFDCFDPYEMVVVVAVPRDDHHHDCRNDCCYCYGSCYYYYYFCEHWEETMTTTKTTDCEEEVRNDLTAHDDSVDDDDLMWYECYDCHCWDDDDSWTTMTISSRTVHPAYIDSIFPSSTSQSSGSVIVLHPTSHLGHTSHLFRIAYGFYS